MTLNQVLNPIQKNVDSLLLDINFHFNKLPEPEQIDISEIYPVKSKCKIIQ